MEIETRTVRTHERDGRAWLDADESAMFAGWRKAHGMAELPDSIFPRLGVVAVLDGVDSAAAWLYMDNSVGVAFMEWIVSRPGLTLAESRACFAFLVGSLRDEAKALGYGLILAHGPHAVAKMALGMGFQDTGHEGKGIALAVA